MNRPTSSSSDNEPAPAVGNVIAEVRYSLPAMLAELKLERSTGSFAMEKLSQSEIGKLFQPQKKRRVKSAS